MASNRERTNSRTGPSRSRSSSTGTRRSSRSASASPQDEGIWNSVESIVEEPWHNISDSAAKRRTRRKELGPVVAPKLAKFIFNNRPKITGQFLHSVCEKSGVCLAFGKESKKIKRFFNGFALSRENSLFITSPVFGIQGDSNNGFVTLIEFSRPFQKRISIKNDAGQHLHYEYINQDYLSHTILKSTMEPDNDNLMYEFLVGQYINRKNLLFPCFLETYGLYKYKSDRAWRSFSSRRVNSITDKKLLINSFDELPKPVDIKIGCQHSKHMAILIQFIKRNAPLYSYLANGHDFYKYQFLYVLFQVYLPLSLIKREFTHYDLHMDNVMLYPAEDGQYFECHYHLPNSTKDRPNIISFKTRYIAKIIDYGRSFFYHNEHANSAKIYQDVCRLNACKVKETVFGIEKEYTCGTMQGFGPLEPEDHPGSFSYISASKRNMSIDLRLIGIMKRTTDNFFGFSMSTANPELTDAIRSVRFDMVAGTPEITTSGLPNFINNVEDAYTKFSQIVRDPAKMRENDAFFADLVKMGDLHIYCDLSRPKEMEWRNP
jgi:hypothetical protein